MSDYTFATVIIDAADQAQAQSDMGEGFFVTALSPTGKPPATNYMSSGPFSNEELDAVANVYVWSKKMYFGRNWQAALTAEGLQLVQEPTDVPQKK